MLYQSYMTNEDFDKNVKAITKKNKQGKVVSILTKDSYLYKILEEFNSNQHEYLPDISLDQIEELLKVIGKTQTKQTVLNQIRLWLVDLKNKIINEKIPKGQYTFKYLDKEITVKNMQQKLFGQIINCISKGKKQNCYNNLYKQIRDINYKISKQEGEVKFIDILPEQLNIIQQYLYKNEFKTQTIQTYYKTIFKPQNQQQEISIDELMNSDRKIEQLNTQLDIQDQQIEIESEKYDFSKLEIQRKQKELFDFSQEVNKITLKEIEIPIQVSCQKIIPEIYYKQQQINKIMNTCDNKLIKKCFMIFYPFIMPVYVLSELEIEKFQYINYNDINYHIRGMKTYVHQEIIQSDKYSVVHHINCNEFDNRKENLLLIQLQKNSKISQFLYFDQKQQSKQIEKQIDNLNQQLTDYTKNNDDEKDVQELKINEINEQMKSLTHEKELNDKNKNFNVVVHNTLHSVMNYVYDKDSRYTNIFDDVRQCFIENYYLQMIDSIKKDNAKYYKYNKDSCL